MISDVLISRRLHRSVLLARLGWLGLNAGLLIIFAINQWQLFIDFALQVVDRTHAILRAREAGLGDATR